jgi:GNAT superfamily N-acetyltransferase
VTDHPIAIRRATAADTARVFDVFHASVADLSRRRGQAWDTDRQTAWAVRGSLFEFLAEHHAEWWVAEDTIDSEIVGYARSVDREGLFELAECFVDPRHQSAGVGRRLLEVAFPSNHARVRVIVATTDPRALARYIRADTVARFPIASFSGPPAATEHGLADLKVARASADDVAGLIGIDRAVLDFPRAADEFAWLLSEREGYLYRRQDVPIGFGFIGGGLTGPIAALDPDDQVPILLHLESRAAALEMASLTFMVPMVNEVAMRHLLDRGLRIEPWLSLFLSNRAFGQFDRYVCFTPEFVL